jgi:TetR/AcrR family transcriptional regulator, cholesterol catabolism regulator
VARKKSLDAATPLRTQILDTASRLFYAQGFAATSIRQIADAVGISSSTLYHHFPDKQGVLDAVLTRFANDFVAELLPLLQDAAVAPPERIARAVRAHIVISAARRPELLLGNPIHHALSPGQNDRWVSAQREYHYAMRSTVADGVARGLFDVPDPTTATLAIMDMLNGVRAWFRPDGALSLEAVSARYVGYALRLLGATIVSIN